jgi:hypothetical protein
MKGRRWFHLPTPILLILPGPHATALSKTNMKFEAFRSKGGFMKIYGKSEHISIKNTSNDI